MKIAIYGRVSSQRQVKQGSGLDVQLDELIKEVQKSGHEYVEYIDEGISGTSLEKRKGLQQLLEDIKDGDIDEVHVTKLSRLGRNTRDVLNVVHEFEKYDVVFKSVRDNVDTSSPMGKVMVQFMSIIAEMERDVIVETTKAGSDFRASMGKIYGSPKILGYNRIGSAKESFLEINEEEAKTIRKIFTLYTNGYGYKAIVTKINTEGHRSKKGNMFTLGTVKGILKNPLYVGKIRYNFHKDWEKKRRRGRQSEYILVEGMHEAIIDEETWSLAQDKLSKNKGKRTTATGKFLLNGILKCPQCGASMVGSNRYRYRKSGKEVVPYYTCGAHHNKGRAACKANSINGRKVEEIVLKQVSEYLQQEELPEIIFQYITKHINDLDKYPAKLKTLYSDLDIIDKKVERVKEMYEEGFISSVEMKSKLKTNITLKDKIKSDIDIIKVQIDEDITPKIDIKVKDIKDILVKMYDVFNNIDDRLLLKKFLQALIESIEVKDRLKADMKVSIKVTDVLLRMFDKEIPSSYEFEYEEEL